MGFKQKNFIDMGFLYIYHYQRWRTWSKWVSSKQYQKRKLENAQIFDFQPKSLTMASIFRNKTLRLWLRLCTNLQLWLRFSAQIFNFIFGFQVPDFIHLSIYSTLHLSIFTFFPRSVFFPFSPDLRKVYVWWCKGKGNRLFEDPKIVLIFWC